VPVACAALGYNGPAMPTDVLLVSIARALAEVAGMLMLGQGILWLFGPRAREGNFVYDLLKKGTLPIMKLTRAITPRFVHDAHIGLVAFLILMWVWFGLGVWKRSLCATYGLQCA
jgi:ABC-type phosphate transport system permease subunit